MIEQQIADVILTQTSLNSRSVVAVCGAADLGKSHLTNQVVRCLQDMGTKAAVLPMDAFLMPRQLRMQKELSGYQADAYDMDAALQCIVDFSQGKPLDYRPYDHGSGAQTQPKVVIEGCSVLLYEGLQVLAKPFRQFIDCAFFIYTDDLQLRKIRSAADISKRGMSEAQSSAISAQEFDSYKTHIEPFKALADYQVLLREKWQYQLGHRIR